MAQAEQQDHVPDLLHEDTLTVNNDAAIKSSFSSDSDADDHEISNKGVASTEEEEEEETEMPPPPTWNISGRKRLLSKQLSMRETTREAKWERRRRQILHRRRGTNMNLTISPCSHEDSHIHHHQSAAMRTEDSNHMLGSEGGLTSRVRSLTDEDLDELRGSIELGFGFSEENGGHDLCDTLPALKLYFAVNRQLSDPKIRHSPSPVSPPTTATSSSSLAISGSPSPRSPMSADSATWAIFNPGDNPQHVKTRLRHWAQAVACSVRQSC